MAITVNDYVGPLGKKLTIPTHVSPLGGQSTHPSVVKFSGPWNGFEYWMAFTPYPNTNDAHEDPNVVASVDGDVWVVPEGLTNPIDDQPGSPGAYNSDTNLVYRADTDTLYLFWRELNRPLASNEEKIWFSTSTDGVTWSAKTLVMQATTNDGKLLSPSLSFDGSVWTMYVVDMDTNPNTLKRYVSTGATPTAWGAATTCTVSGVPSDKDLWHLDAQLVGSTWVGFFSLADLGVGGTNCVMHFGTSANGTTWTLSDNVVIPTVGPWHDAVYKAGFIPLVDAWGNTDFDVWYGAWTQAPPGVWNILRTRVSHIADVVAPTTPGALTADATGLNRTGVSWGASTDDRLVTAYELQRDGVTIWQGLALSYVDQGNHLVPSGTYAYRVRAKDAAGNASGWTATDSATMPSSPTDNPIPDLPTGDGGAISFIPLTDGRISGPASNVAAYRVSEDASPTDLSRGSAGVGGIDASVIADETFDGTAYLRGNQFLLHDDWQGDQVGAVDSLTMIDGVAQITGNSRLVMLNVQRSAAGYTGTLEGALFYYLGLCGILDSIDIDAAVGAIPVTLQSWTGNVWEKIKDLSVIHSFEVSMSVGTVTVRPKRVRSVSPSASLLEETVATGDMAQEITVFYYNNTWGVNAQAYPTQTATPLDLNILSVDAGETLVTNIPISANLSFIQQPIHMETLGPFLSATGSMYAVIDKDSKPVSPKDWKNAGGSVSYALGADGQSVDVTIVGMYTQSRAPYRIASASTDEDAVFTYSALYVVGTGVFFDRKSVTSATGTPVAIAPLDTSITIDNTAVSTIDEAYRVLMGAMAALSGLDHTVRASHDASTEFGGQVFGNVAGSRLLHKNSMFRITTAETTNAGTTWTASADTTFGDHEAVWAAANPTFGTYEAAMGDVTFGQHDLGPLRGGNLNALL